VLTINGSALSLSASIPVQSGDIVYLGDPLAGPVADGDASRALAGRVGYAFARVLVDAAGVRNVPHYRAVDIASDNRIADGATAATTHATLPYRPAPVTMARQRGWTAQGYVVGTAMATASRREGARSGRKRPPFAIVSETSVPPRT
jgi:hypothetical protein